MDIKTDCHRQKKNRRKQAGCQNKWWKLPRKNKTKAKKERKISQEGTSPFQKVIRRDKKFYYSPF